MNYAKVRDYTQNITILYAEDEVGANEYLTKPLDEEEFVEKIVDLIEAE